MAMQKFTLTQLREIANKPMPHGARERARWYWARKELAERTKKSKGGHAMIRAVACSLAINVFLASALLYLANMTPAIYTVIERCWR